MTTISSSSSSSSSTSSSSSSTSSTLSCLRPIDEGGVVQHGEHVILSLNDGTRMKSLKLGITPLHINKRLVDCTPLIGAQYGSLWELLPAKGILVPVSEAEAPGRLVDDQDLQELLEQDDEAATGRNNQELFDDTANQTLDPAQVQALREAGMDGQTLLEKLKEGSKTFHQKTVFSQDKWMARKLQLHRVLLRPLRASARTIAALHALKRAGRFWHIRPDMLGQLLARADLRSGSRVLLWDDGAHLTLAAILERLGDHGEVLHVHSYQSNLGTLTQYASLTPTMRTERIHSVPLAKIANFLVGNDSTEIPEALREGAEALVITAKVPPLVSLSLLYRFLRPSQPFVIFSPTLEPLVQALHALRSRKMCINSSIIELLTRNFQILPGRTRPHNHQHGSSGYIFHGTRILSENQLDPTPFFPPALMAQLDPSSSCPPTIPTSPVAKPAKKQC